MFTEISNELRSKLQNQLINIICKILIKHQTLHYYQVKSSQIRAIQTFIKIQFIN